MPVPALALQLAGTPRHDLDLYPIFFQTLRLPAAPHVLLCLPYPHHEHVSLWPQMRLKRENLIGVSMERQL